VPPAGHAATGGRHCGITTGSAFAGTTGETGTDVAAEAAESGPDGAAATTSGTAKTPATTTSATTEATHDLCRTRNPNPDPKRTPGSNNRRSDTTALQVHGGEAQIIIHRQWSMQYLERKV
jgi:hypothetical protein